MGLFFKKRFEDLSEVELPFGYDKIDKILDYPNGWQVILADGVFILLNNKQVISISHVEFNKLIVAKNGLVMVTSDGNHNEIFDDEGNSISHGCREALLYKSGWYYIKKYFKYTLYNAKRDVVASDLCETKVLSCGHYYIVRQLEKGDLVFCLYNCNNEIVFYGMWYNFECFENGWFIYENKLFNSEAEEIVSDKAFFIYRYRWFKRFIAKMMPY